MIVELPKFIAVLLASAVPSLVGSPPRATAPRAQAVTDTTPPISPSAQQTSIDLPVIGKPAPQLPVQDWVNVPVGKTMGKTITFGDGHVYILDFTATWCGSCPGMYPKMDSLQRQYRTRGLRVIYVTAIWSPHYSKESPAQQLTSLAQYVTKHHMSSPVAVMANDKQFESSGYFPFSNGDYDAGLPAAYLIDGAGNMQAVWEGEEAPFYKAVGLAVAASHPKTP